jgi:hypothetical protein
MRSREIPRPQPEESTEHITESINAYRKGSISIFDLDHATQYVDRTLLAELIPEPSELSGEDAFRCLQAKIILLPSKEENEW